MNESPGVGPHPQPWPSGDNYDPLLLEKGDARNVVDKYRYWTVDAIKADLDTTRLPFEVAIENFQHDFNIGTIVRNANAFNARAVHIIGKRHWNKRGAMVTDLYMHVHYHDSVESFVTAMKNQGNAIIGVDILPGAVPIDEVLFEEDTVLVFGGEGPGLTDEMQQSCRFITKINQFGSTRSMNVGVASGIAMHKIAASLT